MENFFSTNTIVSLLLGISLSAACGLRIFLPFLLIGTVADFGHFPLPTDLQWLAGNQALIMLLIASIVEIISYYVPWLDNALDPFAFPLATAAGTIVTASALPPETNSLVQWTLAAIVGGGSAGLVKGTASLSRLGSTALSGGLTNFVISTAELLGAAILTILALFVPIFAGLVVSGFIFFALFKAYQIFNKRSVDNQLSD